LMMEWSFLQNCYRRPLESEPPDDRNKHTFD
jgi:hypothetical protein